ncbi:sigma factor-like helix-turn-helix DNA-binding protein [Saccharibacillus sacchari]|uniref:sigma factor-like helix-turn-helix DNA-binding protein n=1 Tax=Saccharibacillus sacchari TaxID=456493 RepID=UPI0004B768E5|nr:sigma factor-like helix-turn-helix DNA-binding protein [Saccharibacillus sacchari]
MSENIQNYRRELQRTAWRVAYHQRAQYRKERIGIEVEYLRAEAEPDLRETRRELDEYIELIPFDKGRQIIESIFIEGRTEAETAEMMRMSQQGVSKWKRKSLDHLRRTLNSSYC